MGSIEEWEWIRRFADRLVALQPELWVTTATAIGLMRYAQNRDMEPEASAEKYLLGEPSE